VVGGRLLAVLAVVAVSAARHPSHTSSAELVQSADSVRVAIRVFTDDIAAVGALRDYVRDRFGLVNRRGEAVRLDWDGAEPGEDVLTIRLLGRIPEGLSGARVSNRLLTDRYDDQVNVVRAEYAGRAATLVFVRGDGPKALP
jgi:hypothetical protein